MAENTGKWARWPGKFVCGTRAIELNAWAEFDELVRENMLDYRQYVWRGQASAEWLLEPTLDRVLRQVGKLKSKAARKSHLERFTFAVRGRRGPNPPVMDGEYDWWALGQHQGLATPLLDWTTSPYVAAFFAFESEDGPGEGGRRAIFAISRVSVRKRSEEISTNWKGAGRAPIVEFITPYSDENPRLVSQGGLFTRAPDGVDLEAWIREHFDDGTKLMRLLKVTLPEGQRTICLRALNRMNINHLSLFPDLYGAARFVNMDLRIPKY